MFVNRKTKTKNMKKTKTYLNKNTNDRSVCDNMFSELLLTEKLRHYLQMNATSYH